MREQSIEAFFGLVMVGVVSVAVASVVGKILRRRGIDAGWY